MKKILLFENFFFEFFWSPVSRISAKKRKKRGSLEIFEHPFFYKIEKKMKRDPLETFEKFAKKSLTKPKKPAQKIFGHRRESKKA